MPKIANRPLSGYAHDALALLGGLIRATRKQRGLTAQEVAERAGVSRKLLQRIEKGDPACGIGAVFEAATVVGVPLFDADEDALGQHLARTRDKLQLLPKAVRKPRTPVHDDF